MVPIVIVGVWVLALGYLARTVAQYRRWNRFCLACKKIRPSSKVAASSELCADSVLALAAATSGLKSGEAVSVGDSDWRRPLAGTFSTCHGARLPVERGVKTWSPKDELNRAVP